jgi:dTDP-4-dehydrorhamnose 3,5-epimerase
LSVRATALAGVVVFGAPAASDERGSFARLADRAELEAAGIRISFPQWSVAANAAAGTLRGLHYAAPPHTEAKLVRVVAGAIYDVVLDLRAGSATYGCWAGFELRADVPETLFIPAGCAHGYQTRVADATVVYGISSAYVPEAARGVDPFDPVLAIPWPLAVRAVSARDRAFPPLAQVEALP